MGTLNLITSLKRLYSHILDLTFALKPFFYLGNLLPATENRKYKVFLFSNTASPHFFMFSLNSAYKCYSSLISSSLFLYFIICSQRHHLVLVSFYLNISLTRSNKFIKYISILQVTTVLPAYGRLPFLSLSLIAISFLLL